jgi:hypothetical protein
LNGVFLLLDILGGMFFFRRAEVYDTETSRTLAYLLWGSGVLTGILFLLGMFFIVS